MDPDLVCEACVKLAAGIQKPVVLDDAVRSSAALERAEQLVELLAHEGRLDRALTLEVDAIRMVGGLEPNVYGTPLPRNPMQEHDVGYGVLFVYRAAPRHVPNLVQFDIHLDRPAEVQRASGRK